MMVVRTDCKGIPLYLTEYSRGQLLADEKFEVEKHLEECENCRRELDELIKISLEIDKIIPSTSEEYKNDFIYKLFIKSEKEPVFARIASLAIVIALLFYIISTYNFVSSDDYSSLENLRQRAVNMFDESFYSVQN